MGSAVRHAYDGRTLALVVGRTPLMPIDTLRHIFEAEDCFEALRSLLASEKVVAQALYVASPTLSDALAPWLGGAPLKNRRAALKALAYISRMAFRCTPFGLCAGIGLVNLSTGTTLRVDTDARRTRTRPDMGLLLAVATSLEGGENREKVRYVANPAVLERGDRLYVTNVALTNFVIRENDSAAEQRPVSLKHTAAVKYVREITRQGKCYAEIVRLLAARFNARREEAERVLDRLIEAGAVTSELRPSPIGDPVGYMLRRFQFIDAEVAAKLQVSIDRAAELDRQPLSARGVSHYRAISSAFSATVESGPEHTTQIDLHVPLAGAMNASVVDDASLLAEYLIRMAPVMINAKFRQRFEEHYEGSERLVPLLELIDANLGLGFPDEIETQHPENPKRDRALATVACNAIREGVEEIELTAKELDLIVPPLADMTSLESMEIGFHVVATSREAVDRGDYSITPALFTGSNGAMRSLGRFADLLGEPTIERMRRIAQRETRDGEILTELAFAPADPRFYNVAIRPRILQDEIAFGVGEPLHDQISPEDLWVGLDNGRFFLWSASRQRRVMPRENHLFVTGRFAPNVCRFLASLQYDGKRIVRGFDWGKLSGLTYLPRVRIGRVVLSPRRWTFSRTRPPASIREITEWLEELRSGWTLPRWVLLAENDSRLLVDLDSAVAPELLFDQRLRDQNMMTFVEALPSPEHLWIEGADGRYSVEFVASLVPATTSQSNSKMKNGTASSGSGANYRMIGPYRKRYGLGSEWAFVKLYMGAQAMDGFLASTVLSFVRHLQSTGILDCWFFIRYADPRSHLRLRLRANDGAVSSLREQLITAASQWFEGGKILRYCFDVYDPEFERYGGEAGVNQAERFFTRDSEVCSELLRGLPDRTDDRVAAAVESFLPWLYRDGLADVALGGLQTDGPRSLKAPDRSLLKRLHSGSIQVRYNDELMNIASGPQGQCRLASLFHMHCNRLGLSRDGERRAMVVVRTMLLGRAAGRRQEQFADA